MKVSQRYAKHLRKQCSSVPYLPNFWTALYNLLGDNSDIRTIVTIEKKFTFLSIF